jgi:ribosomal protein L27
LPGLNVKKGADDTLYSVAEGVVKFSDKKKMRFDGTPRVAKVVSVKTVAKA